LVPKLYEGFLKKRGGSSTFAPDGTNLIGGSLARIHGNALAYHNFPGPPRKPGPRENPHTNAILAAVAAHPQTSTRTIAGDLDFNKTAVHNVLRINDYKPHKIHIHRALNGERFLYARLEYIRTGRR